MPGVHGVLLRGMLNSERLESSNHRSWNRLNIKTLSYEYIDSHVKDYKNPLHLDVVYRYLRRMGDYKNPLHLDVVDRYLRRMGDKTIPDEAPPSLESFYPP